MAISKSDEAQAWIRFLLGIAAFAGVVWGASSNITVIANMALSNQRAITCLVEDNRRLDGSIRTLEISSKEYQVNLSNIEKSLLRIEGSLGTK